MKTRELRTYKNQKLMNDLNEMMIRIKRRLLESSSESSLVMIAELDDLQNRLIEVLKKDSKRIILR